MRGFVVLLISAASILSGCGKTFHGVLQTQDNRPLVITHDNGESAIEAGHLKVTLHQGSLLGDGVLELRTMQNQALGKITIPKETTLKALQFHLEPSDIHQQFGLVGHQVATDPQIKTYEIKAKCTYCGACFSPQITTDGEGKVSSTITFGPSCSCAGTQQVLKQDTVIFRTFSIDFIQNSQPRARFVSDPIEDKSSQILHTLSACK